MQCAQYQIWRTSAEYRLFCRALLRKSPTIDIASPDLEMTAKEPYKRDDILSFPNQERNINYGGLVNPDMTFDSFDI